MDAKKYLAENPKCDEIHATSDGTLFYNLSDARNHARTLANEAVVTERRAHTAPADATVETTQLLAATGEAAPAPETEAAPAPETEAAPAPETAEKAGAKAAKKKA